MIRPAGPDEAAGLVDAYEWLFAPPGSRPPSWDPARSQGVGEALLDGAKAWAAERGATHLELDSGEARADAHRFYEREQPSARSICFGWEL